MSNKRTDFDTNWVRRNLAFIITLVCIGGTIVLTCVAINFISSSMPAREVATDVNRKDAFSMLQSILGFVLPLIGTWMGTILAFYFSKENFDAASKSVNEMYRNVATTSPTKFESKNAYEESRKVNEIRYNKDIVDKKDGEILIQKNIYEFLKSNSEGDRIPIIDTKNIVRYIIHMSTVNDFLLQYSNKKLLDLVDKKMEELTLFDMAEKSNNQISEKLTKGIEFVSTTSTLAEVQLKMKTNSLCQDVFITQTGKSDQPILGWITNNRLTELSKA